MSRRSRVKPVANLISSRNKRPQIEKEAISNEISQEIGENSSKIKDPADPKTIQLEIDAEISQVSSSETSETSEKPENATIKSDKSANLDQSDKCSEPLEGQAIEIPTTSDDNNTFKKPQTAAQKAVSQNQSSNNEDSSGTAQNSSKGIRPRVKIQPRLRSSRIAASSSQKSAEENVENVNQNSSEIVQETNNNNQNEKDQEKESEIPSVEVQSPIKVKSHIFESPKLSHLMERETLTPSTPPVQFPASPFSHPHTPHSRIRTESVCSMKSNFSGIGGVVRKNFRSEENQRIIDTKRESKVRLANKNLDKTQLLMFDMIYYNPASNPMKVAEKNAQKRDRSRSSTPAIEPPTPEPIEEPETDSSNSCLVPQVKLGPNGELILDEKSLVVENEQQKQNRILLANANVVYDDELSGTYGYYKRQKRTREWPPEETIKFYRCLATIGTDFSLMLQLFTNRTRRDLKLKFKKEEKNNLALINRALMQPNTFDIDELKRNLDYDEEMRKKNAENKTKNEVHAILKKEILKKQQAAKAKTNHKRKSKVDRMMTDGDIVNELVDNPTSNLGKEKENVAKETVVRREKRSRPAKEQPNLVSAGKRQKINILEDKIIHPASPAPPVNPPTPNHVNTDSETYLIELAAENPPIILENTEDAGFVQGKEDCGIKILDNQVLDKNQIVILDAPIVSGCSGDFDNFETIDMDIDYTCPTGDSTGNIALPAFVESFQNNQEILNLSNNATSSDFYSKFFPTKSVQVPCKEAEPLVQTSVQFYASELDVGNEVTIDDQHEIKSDCDNSNVQEANYPEATEDPDDPEDLSTFADNNLMDSVEHDEFPQELATTSANERQLILKMREEEDALEHFNQSKNESADFDVSKIVEAQGENPTPSYFAQESQGDANYKGESGDVEAMDVPIDVVQNVEIYTNDEIVGVSKDQNESLENLSEQSGQESLFCQESLIGQESLVGQEGETSESRDYVEILDEEEEKQEETAGEKDENEEKIEEPEKEENKIEEIENEEREIEEPEKEQQKIEALEEKMEEKMEEPVEKEHKMEQNKEQEKEEEEEEEEEIIRFKRTPKYRLPDSDDDEDENESEMNKSEVADESTEKEEEPAMKIIENESNEKKPVTEEVPIPVEHDEKPGTSGLLQTSEKEPEKMEASDDEDDDDYIDKILSDIDLNSLVLVEKQTPDNKTIHEIYVMDPVTEELSEKPLDLPREIIESIRKVVENEDT